MQPEKIGPKEHPHIIPASPAATDDVSVKRTDQKQLDIPSVKSEQIAPPEQQAQIRSANLFEEDRSVELVDKSIESVEQSMELPPKTIEQLTKNLSVLQVWREKVEKAGSVNEAVMTIAQAPTEIINKVLLEPYQLIAPLLIDKPEHTPIGSLGQPVGTAALGIKVVKIIGDGALIMIKDAILHSSEKQLEYFEKILETNPNNEEVRKSIVQLKLIISQLKEDIKEKMVDFAMNHATASLKTTALTFSAFSSVISPLARSGAGWATSILDVIGEAVTLWRAQKASTTHEVWMTEISKNPRTFKQAENLLAQRQERMILNKIEKLKLNFDEFKQYLVDKKVVLDANIQDMSDFREQLSTNTSLRNEVTQVFIDPEDEKANTINVMTRNAIQTLGKQKIINEKKFFDFKLNKSKISLIMACVSTALAITLEALILTGVLALSASVALFPPIGFLVLGVALAGVGLFFFYKHKPNLFKCFIKGVNLKLAFYTIPAQIRAIQLKNRTNVANELKIRSARYEQLKGLLNQTDTLNRISYPKELQKILSKLQKQTARNIEDFDRMGTPKQIEAIQEQLEMAQAKQKLALEKAISDQNEMESKYDIWLGKYGKVTILQNKLREAGSQDFAIANRLIETAKKEKMNIPEVIANGIMEGQSHLDEETTKILKEKMGIDIKQLSKEIQPSEKDKIKADLADFFKMEENELYSFMKLRLQEIEASKPVEE